MRLIYLGLKMYVYGYYCDFCIKACEKTADELLKKNKPLNNRLLIILSNLSNKSILKWKQIEERFISQCLKP